MFGALSRLIFQKKWKQHHSHLPGLIAVGAIVYGMILAHDAEQTQPPFRHNTAIATQ